MISLPDVTLCAASSVNIDATISALTASMAHVQFADCLLFTDVPIQVTDKRIKLVKVDRLHSARSYSAFILDQLGHHIETSHCLVVQWDGHVVDAGRWDPAFLAFDYIGARWPQFHDGHDVGNGGFSLRSRRLLLACQSARFANAHPEDVAIGRTHRPWLEELGMRFADQITADRFSAERIGVPSNCFGFHGVWHLPAVLGVEQFWEIYRTLDARGTIQRDFVTLLKQVLSGRGGVSRALRLLADQAIDMVPK